MIKAKQRLKKKTIEFRVDVNDVMNIGNAEYNVSTASTRLGNVKINVPLEA